MATPPSVIGPIKDPDRHITQIRKKVKHINTTFFDFLILLKNLPKFQISTEMYQIYTQTIMDKNSWHKLPFPQGELVLTILSMIVGV